MTTGRKLAIGFIVLWIAAIAFGVADRAHAGTAPVTTPLPTTPPLGWCYSGPVPNAANDVSIRIGDCPAPPPTSCPAGRAIRADAWYPPSTALRRNVDLTDFASVWGHKTATDAQVPWPGYAGSGPVLNNILRNAYIAAKFTVPLNTSSGTSGYFKNVSNYGGLNVTVSISERCGDFAPAQPGCLRADVPPSDAGLVYWRMVNPTNFQCKLAAGVTYYLNIKNANPAQDHPNCRAGIPGCKVHVLNNVTR